MPSSGLVVELARVICHDQHHKAIGCRHMGLSDDIEAVLQAMGLSDDIEAVLQAMGLSDDIEAGVAANTSNPPPGSCPILEGLQ